MNRTSLLDEFDGAVKIDLSPMIDCIFILLIFFIVTTVFIEAPEIDVSKPEAVTAANLEKNSIIIAISEHNKIVYGGKEMSLAGMGARVRQILTKGDMPVIIQADKAAEHGVFSDVWSEVRNAGATTINLSTRKD